MPNIIIRPLRSTSPHRPAFNIHHRRIRIDTGNFISILCSPVVDNQSSPAHTFQNNFLMEAFFYHLCIQFIPTFDSFVRPIHISHITIGNMKSLFQQRNIRLRLMSPKSSTHHPRLSFRLLIRFHNLASSPVTIKLISTETMKIKFFFTLQPISFILFCTPCSKNQIRTYLTSHFSGTDRRRMQAIR